MPLEPPKGPFTTAGQGAGQEPRSTSIEEWGTLNTKANRPAIQANEFSWIENFMPIGHGNMRTLYDKGSNTYTTSNPRTIISLFPYNLGSVNYVAVFLDDGSAEQIRTSDGAATTIAAAGTFYDSGDIPCCTQYQAKYLIIGSTANEDGYFVWDGTSLFQAGTLGPQVVLTNVGDTYTSAPTVTAYGGSGSGATFSATVSSDGAVVDVDVTNPGSGYLVGEHVQLVFTGGGSDNQARAHATVDSTKGGVTRIQLTNGGSAYTSDVSVTITGGGGSGAEAVVSSAVNGKLVSITVTKPGSGYTSAPTIGFTATAGSGATAVANITRGQITAITVDSAGTGYTGAPDVLITVPDGQDFPTIQATATATISAGGVSGVTVTNAGAGYLNAGVQLVGGNDAANAEITLMPHGLQATSMEVYQNAVWTAEGTKMTFSAPSSVSDFSTAAGGGSVPATDSFLRQKIVALKQANGFLYRIADSSINVISNVQTSSAAITTFNNSNVDAQIGSAWRDTVVAFGRAIVFANPNGVYALYGGAAEKVSDALDGLFAKASFNTAQSGVTPTAGVATIFGIRCYCLLFTTTDPYSGSLRNIVFVWDGQKWFAATQTVTLKLVAPEEINSILTTWATDGTHLFKTFQTASSSLTKVFQTKLSPGAGYNIFKQALRGYLVTQNNSSTPATLTAAVDNEAGNGVEVDVTAASTLTFVGSSPITFVGTSAITWTVGGLQVTGWGTNAYGRMLGWTVTTSASDCTVISITMLERDYAPYA